MNTPATGSGRSLEEMAEKGKAKLSSKAVQMQIAYHAAKGRAIRN